MAPPLTYLARFGAGSAAIIVLLIVALVYSRSGTPPGHPWSGITLVMLAVSLLSRAVIPPQRPLSVVMALVVAALSLASALNWLWAT